MRIFLCFFNGHWNIYFYGKEIDFKDFTLETRGNQRGQFRLRTYNTEAPIYGFGFWCDNPKERPGHGGEWSSNSDTINSQFGTNLKELAYNQMSMAAPLPWIKEMIGSVATWKKDLYWGEKITHIKNVQNKDHQWVEIINQNTSHETSHPLVPKFPSLLTVVCPVEKKIQQPEINLD